MVSLGYPDGQTMPRRELGAAVRRIADRLSVPLSADVVAGFGRSAGEVARTVSSVLGAGAVGINLEDLDPSNGRLFRVAAQVEKLRAVRRTADAIGIPLVINARTDALRHHPGTPTVRFKEAVRRACAYRDAGADCVYPMGLTDAGSISAFVRAVDTPVNVMVRAGLPPVGELERLRVRRLSFGPSASYAAMGLLRRASREIITRGTFTGLVDGAITFDELNLLARPKPLGRIRG